MKIIEHHPAAKKDDFLSGIARSIGSTLGVVAATVRATGGKPRRRRVTRKRARKANSAAGAGRRNRAPSATRRHKGAGQPRRRKRNKIAK